MICFPSFPLCCLLVIARMRSRSFFVALELGHRCMKCQRGLRWRLRLLRIVHPRNTKPSLPIACVGVLVLFRWGCWPSPACPRTYLLASPIKARPLPSSVLSCTPSPVLRTSRTPSRIRALSAFRPYMLGLCPTRLPGRVSPVPRCSVPTCHRLRPRGAPASVPEPSCCLLPSP